MNRFSADGDCAPYCVDIAAEFLGIPEIPASSLSAVGHMSEVMTLLLKHRLSVFGYLPRVALSRPKMALWCFRNRDRLVFSSSVFAGICNVPGYRFAVMHHLTCGQLYGTNELWSHWVIELNEGPNRRFHDGLDAPVVSSAFAADKLSTKNWMRLKGPKLLIANL